MSFFLSFGTPVSIARPFNTYGPRQSARAIIPTIIIQIASGKRIIRIGSLHPTRDFNYVKDTIHGLIKIAENDQTIGEIINIGSNYEISIGDTVRKIASIMGVQIEVEIDPQRIRPEKSEVERLRADNTKIATLTGWKPSYTLDDGLKETIEWFDNAKNLLNYKTDIYNI
jgi:dTDP-glucose 4,6-dehydratase